MKNKKYGKMPKKQIILCLLLVIMSLTIIFPTMTIQAKTKVPKVYVITIKSEKDAKNAVKKVHTYAMKKKPILFKVKGNFKKSEKLLNPMEYGLQKYNNNNVGLILTQIIKDDIYGDEPCEWAQKLYKKYKKKGYTLYMTSECNTGSKANNYSVGYYYANKIVERCINEVKADASIKSMLDNYIQENGIPSEWTELGDCEYSAYYSVIYENQTFYQLSEVERCYILSGRTGMANYSYDEQNFYNDDPDKLTKWDKIQLKASEKWDVGDYLKYAYEYGHFSAYDLEPYANDVYGEQQTDLLISLNMLDDMEASNWVDFSKYKYPIYSKDLKGNAYSIMINASSFSVSDKISISAIPNMRDSDLCPFVY